MRLIFALLTTLALAACVPESASVLRARADDIERRERAATAEAMRAAAATQQAVAVQVATQRALDATATWVARPTSTSTPTMTPTMTPLPTETLAPTWTPQPTWTSTAQPSATATVAPTMAGATVTMQPTLIVRDMPSSGINNPLLPLVGLALIVLALVIGVFATRPKK